MKLIDWTKVPRGTMTNKGEIVGVANQSDYPTPRMSVLHDSKTGWRVTDYKVADLRIAPQTRWTYHDGEECPVPEGLMIEVEYLLGYVMQEQNGYRWDKIVAYRITGVDSTGNYTDRPEEVTE